LRVCRSLHNLASVYEYHPDSYALEFWLVIFLKVKAPLYKTLVEDKKTTDEVELSQYNSEIAGQYILNVVAFDKTELNAVMTGI
jgi:zinc protease